MFLHFLFGCYNPTYNLSTWICLKLLNAHSQGLENRKHFLASDIGHFVSKGVIIYESHKYECKGGDVSSYNPSSPFKCSRLYSQ